MDVGILTEDRLKELLSYDPESGKFEWRAVRGGGRPGREPGAVSSNGYRRIGVDGTKYAAHRLAWFYVYNEWPGGMIDHINGDRLDNRIDNLRVATNELNQQNQRCARIDNKIGLLGVNWEKWSRKYKAQIRVHGKKLLIGRFDCPLTAHRAYLEAKRRLHDGCTI